MTSAAQFRAHQWRLVVAQIFSGVGIASGFAVGGILAEDLTGSASLAGFAQTASILGAALVAIPLARVAEARGRRAALPLGYGLAAVGAMAILGAAAADLPWLFFLGMLFFGSATAAGLQARFAATDLAPEAQRARALSVVVWASTVGSVAGPNLSELGADAGASVGLPAVAGPFLFALAGFAVAVVASLGLHGAPREAHREPRPGLGHTVRLVLSRPTAALGVAAVTGGHMMMVSVMVMTPVHMSHEGMGLVLVGVVISLHILGMYALSPVVGILTDRLGERAVIGIGLVLFLGAVILGAAAGASMPLVTAALVLLGLGWSACLIAGSSLLAASAEGREKVALQGMSDAVMNLGAAVAAALAGPLLAAGGFLAINLAAAVVLLALTVIALRVGRRSR